MSSTHVQLWLSALALVAYALFTLGLRWQDRSDRSRRSIGALAILACVAAPTLVTLSGRTDPRSLLEPSLLVAAVGLLATVLFALLSASRHRRQRPVRRRARPGLQSHPEAVSRRIGNPNDEQLVSIDSGSVMGRGRSLAFQAPEPDVAAPPIADFAPMPSRTIGIDPATMAELDAIDDWLDLDESDRLFRALREQDESIDLPDRIAWFDAARSIADGELVSGERPASPTLSGGDEVIEADVLLASDRPAASVDGDVAGGSPRSSGGEADTARTTPDPLAQSRQATGTARQRHHADRLVDAEREARVAAEELVDRQRGLIDELQHDVQRLKQRARTLQTTLDQYVLMLGKANETARIAARVARVAANARVESDRQLTSERTARERQQVATDGAVIIARNAIAALPEQAPRTPVDIASRDAKTGAKSAVDAVRNGPHEASSDD